MNGETEFIQTRKGRKIFRSTFIKPYNASNFNDLTRIDYKEFMETTPLKSIATKAISTRPKEKSEVLRK